MSTLALYDAAVFFAGVQKPIDPKPRPGETERQADQRVADELRQRYADACRTTTQDEE
jgi:hypothetical protein